MLRNHFAASLAAVVLLAGATAALAQTPTVDSRGAINSASFVTGPVAAGSLVSIFGSNFATANTLASTIPLSVSLANVTVTFNGTKAPISGVFHDATNGDQINVQVPWEVQPVGAPTTAQMVVTVGNNSSASVPVGIAPAAPGIFAIKLANGQVVGSGSGQAIAYGNTDGQIAAPAGAITGLATHAAKVNDPNTLVILVTGLGPVDTTVNDGDVPGVIISNCLTKPTVIVGSTPAQVSFCGMVGRDGTGKAFGFVGVYQLNIVIAPGTQTGDAVPLTLQMNGVSSQPGVTIAVQN